MAGLPLETKKGDSDCLPDVNRRAGGGNNFTDPQRPLGNHTILFHLPPYIFTDIDNGNLVPFREG